MSTYDEIKHVIGRAEPIKLNSPEQKQSTVASITEPQVLGVDGTHRNAHYGTGLQPWDLIVSLGFGEPFAAGNIIKYVGRYNKKGGLQDLYKARWYLTELIKLVEKNGPK